MMKPTEHGKSGINPRRLPPARVAKRIGPRRYKRRILNDESSLRAKFRNRTSATTNDPFTTYTYTFLELSKLISRFQPSYTFSGPHEPNLEAQFLGCFWNSSSSYSVETTERHLGAHQATANYSSTTYIYTFWSPSSSLLGCSFLPSYTFSETNKLSLEAQFSSCFWNPWSSFLMEITERTPRSHRAISWSSPHSPRSFSPSLFLGLRHPELTIYNIHGGGSPLLIWLSG
jgi:hypothetical protein